MPNRPNRNVGRGGMNNRRSAGGAMSNRPNPTRTNNNNKPKQINVQQNKNVNVNANVNVNKNNRRRRNNGMSTFWTIIGVSFIFRMFSGGKKQKQAAAKQAQQPAPTPVPPTNTTTVINVNTGTPATTSSTTIETTTPVADSKQPATMTIDEQSNNIEQLTPPIDNNNNTENIKL